MLERVEFLASLLFPSSRRHQPVLALLQSGTGKMGCTNQAGFMGPKSH